MRRLLAAVFAVALVAIACSGGSDDAPVEQVEPARGATEQETVAHAPDVEAAEPDEVDEARGPAIESIAAEIKGLDSIFADIDPSWLDGNLDALLEGGDPSIFTAS